MTGYRQEAMVSTSEENMKWDCHRLTNKELPVMMTTTTVVLFESVEVECIDTGLTVLANYRRAAKNVFDPFNCHPLDSMMIGFIIYFGTTHAENIALIKYRFPQNKSMANPLKRLH